MKTLLGAAEIRELAKELDLKPTKKLGQNFVVDANTCRKIVKLAEVVEGDIALEIGPGLGSLTLALLDSKKLIVLNQDAMGLMQLPAKPTVLVANLPYNISVPVLLNLLERFPSINRGVVMVQSEVAYRLAAKPGNKQYGSPTAKANWWVDLEMAGSVGRSVFWPIPNVDSSLVRFTRHAPLGDERQRTATFSIIDQAFAKRRKMMRSAIADLFAGEAENNLIAAGIDPTIRGEALSVEQFFQIGEQLLAQNSRK
jgi:16S rRNA (adenine1518-N6/adenine1519-N6)-dimethyltransferase